MSWMARRGCDIRYHRQADTTRMLINRVSHLHDKCSVGVSYKVPILSSHLQATATTLAVVVEVPVTDDILKGVTSTPVASSGPRVPFHGVWFGKVVPGAEEVDGSDGRRSLATVTSVCGAQCRSNQRMCSQEKGHKRRRRHWKVIVR